MFPHLPCARTGCSRAALSGHAHCVEHLPSLDEAVKGAARLLEGSAVHKDLNLSGLPLKDLDLSRKRFFACSFSGAELSTLLFTGASFRLCFLDFCKISACDFSHSDIQFSSFAGSTITNSSFESSEIIHVNFNGVRASDWTLNDCDLYNSRFIRAELSRVDIANCNLKKTYFLGVREQEVSFRSSNTQEAIFQMERGGE